MTHLQTYERRPAAAASPSESANPPARRPAYVLPLVIGMVVLGIGSTRGYYTPGSDFGYYMGVVGGVMMLALLLYPLRKHVRFLQSAGSIRYWFRLHMMFGVVGPLLILYHSTFTIGSLNAGVAMACMLLVAGSGVLGRFIYRRIHHGLYGRRANLDELQSDLGIREGEVRSKFHFAPRIEAQLKAFGELAHERPPGVTSGAWRFLTLGFRARRVRSQCMRELKTILRKKAKERGWERDKLRRRLAAANQMLKTYLDTARNAAQFQAYERMFSLWHVLHVPFVFMLVISGVVHVIAVHMY
jgi:hypothetical protein